MVLCCKGKLYRARGWMDTEGLCSLNLITLPVSSCQLTLLYNLCNCNFPGVYYP